jgi:hypothetical protein
MTIASRRVRTGGVTKGQLLEQLRQAGVELNSAAEELFADPRFETLAAAETVDVVDVAVEELGLAEGGTMPAILEAAGALGLVPCPLELGPHWRLQFQAQEEGHVGFPETKNCAPPGSITVVSEPVGASAETPRGFYLRRIDGTSWLRGYRSDDGHVWAAKDRLAFCLAKGAA